MGPSLSFHSKKSLAGGVNVKRVTGWVVLKNAKRADPSVKADGMSCRSCMSLLSVWPLKVGDLTEKSNQASHMVLTVCAAGAVAIIAAKSLKVPTTTASVIVAALGAAAVGTAASGNRFSVSTLVSLGLGATLGVLAGGVSPPSKDLRATLAADNESNAATIPRPLSSCGVDHLVYICQDLQAGMAAVEKLTGVLPSYGGHHPGLGTHNALLSLGDTAYLEIIAPDPSQEAPARPRVFGLDESLPDGLISAFCVHPTGSHTTIQRLAAALQHARGRSEPEALRQQSRVAPSGESVHWTFSSPWAARTALPFLIDWAGSPTSPHHNAPRGCQLVQMSCCVDMAERDEKLQLLQRIGLQGLRGVPSTAPPPFSVHVLGTAPSAMPAIIAIIDTPRKGQVRLGWLDHDDR